MTTRGYSILKSTKSFILSKDSTCILSSFTISDRAHLGPWQLACTVIARPAYFSLSHRLYAYNQHTQQFARCYCNSHVTHTPKRTVRNARCRIVYERSQHIRPYNNEKGITTHPKVHGWSSYTPGAAKQPLKPAHVGFLKKWCFLLLDVSLFPILTTFLTCQYARVCARVYSK